MRSAYLNPSNHDYVGGCRGGVGGFEGEYALEISQQCNADPKMLALCTLIDELDEFLKISPSPLAAMLRQKWNAETQRLTASEGR